MPNLTANIKFILTPSEPLNVAIIFEPRIDKLAATLEYYSTNKNLNL